MTAYRPAHAAITRAFEDIGMLDASEAAHIALTALVDDEGVRAALEDAIVDDDYSPVTYMLAALTPPGDDE